MLNLFKILINLLFINLILSINIYATSTTTLTSGESLNVMVNPEDFRNYKIYASSSQNINIELYRGGRENAFACMYVKKGSLANQDNYDYTNCNNNQDTYNLTATSNGFIYIGVYPKEGGYYDIKATVSGNGNTLVTKSGGFSSSVSEGFFKYYKVPANNYQNIQTSLYNLSADIDLYIGIGLKPTIDSYTCISQKAGLQNESCFLNLNNNKDIYIGVYGYESGNYSMRVTLPTKSSHLAPISVGDGIIIFVPYVK